MAFSGTEIDNGELANYTIAQKTVSGKQFQGIIFADENGDEINASNPLPVEGTFTPAVAVAETPVQTNDTVSVAKTILAADSARKGGWIQAAWGNSDNIYLSLNTPATSADIPLAPGGIFMLTLNYGGPPISNAIYGIAGSGTQSYAVIVA